MRATASVLCMTITLIPMNILKMCVLQGLMDLMQHPLQLWPMPVLVFPIQSSR